MKIFLSYAHDSDSPSHAVKVRLLADRLRSHDLEGVVDQYDPDPESGWLDWMDQQINEADRVLIVFTKLYHSRWYDEDKSKSWGARWEGKLIKIRIGVQKEPISKYIPVLFEGGSPAHIPTILLDRSRYELRTFSPDDAGFARLTKHLTGRDLDPTGESIRPRPLQFELRARPTADGKPDEYVVRLDWEGNGSAEERFDGDPLGSTTMVEALKCIDAGRDEKEHLKIVGLQLWEGLMTGGVRELFQAAWRKGMEDGRIFHLRLTLPPRLDALPWEALYNEEENGFLAAREQYCIIRTGSGRFPPAPPRAAAARTPGILLVVPKGSGLDLARESQTIGNLAAVLGDAVRVGRVEDPITLGRLGEEIARGGWDVVHFAGHGRFVEGRGVEIRLNDEQGGEQWVDADRFATAFNKGGVRLVVLNCCRGASASGSRSIAGLGPVLIGRRVTAVVAMRYEIADDAALRFAERFYRELLTGAQPGRVDVAIEAARVAIFQNPSGESQRGFVTPTLYLAPDGEKVFDLPKLREVARDVPAEEKPVRPPPGGPTDPLERLIKAIQGRRCIPVLGAGLLSGGAFRKAAPPPGPCEPPGLRELAESVARASAYPDPSDFDLLERGGEWLEGMILRRVCEHLRGDPDRAYELDEIVEKAFRSCKPPETIAALAGWDVPGYICLYIDGLLEQGLVDRKKPYRALQLDDPAPAELEVTRLVHLCGTWRERARRGPALTEQEHDALWDRLARPPDWLTNLITAARGRSLLFLGAHPRDPLARWLASRLYAQGVANYPGPIYFASLNHRPADHAYWASFNVRWIDRAPAELVSEVEAALRPDREAARR